MPEKLNRTTARGLADRPVRVLQFGEGNFLRAFADWMIDILNEQTDFNASVNVVQPLPNGMAKLINEQDGLYHVILNGIENGVSKKETRLISCINTVINPYESPDVFLKQGENNELRIVISNTTEAGISFNPKDNNDKLAESFPGKVTALLYHRFKFFEGAKDRGLVFMPCELIDKNGENLKNCILQYCAHWNLPNEFTRWVTEANTFCNTLVDRIVPGFPGDQITEIQEELGYEDKIVVKAEIFHLWVIEGPGHLKEIFPVDKTSLHVKFVEDLTPYRTRKVRILNGAHTAMVPYAYMHGLRTVEEAVDDPSTRRFVDEIIFREIIPTLDLPKEELISFANSVIERFRNPFIRHELSSIALNSISKFKVRVLPSLIEFVRRTGSLPDGLAESLAWLIVFYRKEWQAEKLPVNDVNETVSLFDNAWNKGPNESVAHRILSDKTLWDTDLTQVRGLEETVQRHINSILVAEKKTKVVSR